MQLRCINDLNFCKVDSHKQLVFAILFSDLFPLNDWLPDVSMLMSGITQLRRFFGSPLIWFAAEVELLKLMYLLDSFMRNTFISMSGSLEEKQL